MTNAADLFAASSIEHDLGVKLAILQTIESLLNDIDSWDYDDDGERYAAVKMELAGLVYDCEDKLRAAREMKAAIIDELPTCS